MNTVTISDKPKWLCAINEALRKIVQEVLAGDINDATARCNLKEAIIAAGYHPGTAHIEPDSPEDLLFDSRINLVIKTNVELSQGAGAMIQGNNPAVLEAFPCQEFIRFGQPKGAMRDWKARWTSAAANSGDTNAARVLAESGRMVARKGSPIWQALGDGAGGYEDTFGNPFPPFAFNSGMNVLDVDYDDAEQLGLVDINTKVQPAEIDSTQMLPIESERITAFLGNEPKLCEHCDEEKLFKLLETCDACGELICPDCAAKECPGPEPAPPPRSAMQCFSTAVGKMMGEKLPLGKDVAEQVLQWCDRAFEFGFAAHLRDFEARAHRMRGEAFESLGQKESALREYEVAVEKDPQVGVKKRIVSLRKELSKS